METEKKWIGRCIFVVVGDFNPAILHPEWFDRHKIMPADEIAGLFAEPKIIELPEIGAILEYGQKFLVEPTQAQLHFESFFLKVNRSKFELVCEKREKFPLLLEVIKKFFKILPETPVKAFGINFDEHFIFRENKNKIINKFFNKTEILDKFFGYDCEYGHKIFAKIQDAKVRFKIEPSQLLKEGVYLSINFHYDNESSDTDFIVNMIDKSFNEALKFTENILQTCGEILERLTVMPKLQ